MVLSDIPANIQPLVELQYESYIKTILLVGWFIFALYYLMYKYKHQEPTKLFLLGTFRASMYITAWLYSWLFWLIYPVFIHPAVPVDQLLIFLAWAYTIISTIFFVIFIFNVTLWIPRFIVRFGKIDLEGWEDHAISNYFGKGRHSSWFKSGKK